MLAELVDATLATMLKYCSEAKHCRSFFWIWDMIKEKLQKFGFYNDVLRADAMTLGASKHRQLFQKASAHALAGPAGAAFGLEQVACPQFSILVAHVERFVDAI